MGRLFRIAPLVVALLAIGVAAWGVANWLSERRKRVVFPASRAQMLLNPLRQRVMPSRKTLERFGLEPGQTVLEVGPGPGYYSTEASQMLGEKGRLLCLDVQRGMLELLSRRLSDAGAENVDLVVADAAQLPLREGAVDGAFLVTVLGEVPNQEAALGELRRAVRPGGALGFSESLGDPDIVFPARLRRLCGDAGFIESGHWRNPLGYTMTFRSRG